MKNYTLLFISILLLLVLNSCAYFNNTFNNRAKANNYLRETLPIVDDGHTTVATDFGRSHRILTDPIGKDHYFYFSLNDSVAYQGNKPTCTITVDYYDTGGLVVLRLQYDATASAYKDHPNTIMTGGTNTWKTATFAITDAYFGNRQNNSADFRINVNGTNQAHIDFVSVKFPNDKNKISCNFAAADVNNKMKNVVVRNSRKERLKNHTGVKSSMKPRLNAEGRKANPIFENIYTADPSAHTWEDGRLYVYPSHDIAPPRGCDLMDKYHVFSTDDMIKWIDHGEILAAKDVPWGRPEGGFMWAPDCAYKNDTYYFYFPHPGDSNWNESWKIGVATSKKPASGFVCKEYIPGLGGHSMIDPAVFIDDGGQAYIVYGGGSKCQIGKLKENMMEIDGEMKEISSQLHDYHEGPMLFKRNNIYYLIYADNYIDTSINQSRNRMHYSMAKNPMGPYSYGGIILDTQSSDTSHGSVVEFKGEWYLFYHNADLSGGITNLRSVCVDKVHFNPDSTIQTVKQTF